LFQKRLLAAVDYHSVAQEGAMNNPLAETKKPSKQNFKGFFIGRAGRI
jgi:hypothetical protein